MATKLDDMIREAIKEKNPKAKPRRMKRMKKSWRTRANKEKRIRK